MNAYAEHGSATLPQNTVDALKIGATVAAFIGSAMVGHADAANANLPVRGVLENFQTASPNRMGGGSPNQSSIPMNTFEDARVLEAGPPGTSTSAGRPGVPHKPHREREVDIRPATPPSPPAASTSAAAKKPAGR
jgi:hypothetical protein